MGLWRAAACAKSSNDTGLLRVLSIFRIPHKFRLSGFGRRPVSQDGYRPSAALTSSFEAGSRRFVRVSAPKPLWEHARMDLQATLFGIRNAFILMAVVLVIEAVFPLAKRTSWNWRHLLPNLTMALITFAMGVALNLAVLVELLLLRDARLGLFNMIGPVSPWIEIPAVLLALDFAWYLTHVSMHKSRTLWRFHAMHHSDPAVDVTTTYRQHPVEGLLRYAYLAVFAALIGASPAAFAFYRIWTVFMGQAEHANVRLPERLDTAISWFTMSPTMHKVHHSRDPRFTDTNYSQIFSIWDRLFGTVTPARLGRNVSYGLDGYDGREYQSVIGLLRIPFRRRKRIEPISAGTPDLARSSSS
jgi:sterol desaturase/sphingolipid hydroxylase (fatty acid hydroxylase superfamily)